jgi:allantoin racemase
MARILVLNPNTTEAITDRLMAAASVVAAPGTTLIPLTAPRGAPYISSRADAQIGGAVALEMLAEHHGKADAAIIAAFGDPGLGGARELFDIPVIGMAEAAMLTACMLGRSFAIVTFSEGLVAWYNECLDWNGLRRRCAGVFSLQGAFRSIADVQDEKAEAILTLVGQVVKNHGADVVILAGAPLSGLADRLRDKSPVPLVDGIQAAVKQAEALAALCPAKAQAGTFARPPAKVMTGVPAALARRFDQTD